MQSSSYLHFPKDEGRTYIARNEFGIILFISEIQTAGLFSYPFFHLEYGPKASDKAASEHGGLKVVSYQDAKNSSANLLT